MPRRGHRTRLLPGAQPRGRLAAPTRRAPPPGALPPSGPPQERPRLPDPSRGTFSAGPRSSVPPQPRSAPARKRRRWRGAKRGGEAKGLAKASLGAAAAESYLPRGGDRRSRGRTPGSRAEGLPSPLNMMSRFPLPSAAARPPPPAGAPRAARAPLPCAAPPAGGGGREGGSPGAAPLRLWPRFPGGVGGSGRQSSAAAGERDRAAEAALARFPSQLPPPGGPRRHGAQPAAPLRGREWGPGGGTEGEGPAEAGGGAVDRPRQRPRPLSRRRGQAVPVRRRGQAARGPLQGRRDGLLGRAAGRGRAARLVGREKGFGGRVGPTRAGFPCDFFFMEPHKALVFTPVVCCYLPSTRTSPFIVLEL